MKSKKEISYSLGLLIQLQKLSSNERQNGYAMMTVSVMSILIFSMLSIYLFSSRLNRATANAMINSGSTFYAAEYGLNKRANNMRSKIGNFTKPTGDAPTGTSVTERMANCLGSNASLKGTGDFACMVNESDYKEAVIAGAITKTGSVSVSNALVNDANVKYRNYSFAQEIVPAGGVSLRPITTGDFRGLNSLDYRYRVYSTAVKNATGSAEINAQSMLQMEFVDRFIPIFQFAAFYEKDLEVTSSTTMTINGPVHSNSSLYLAPGGLLTFNGNVTYVGSIFRSLAYPSDYGGAPRRILFGGGGPYVNKGIDCNGITKGCLNVTDAWDTGKTFPIAVSGADIAASNGRIGQQNRLRMPPSGFLSKTDASGNPGQYYKSADLRVDFDPRNAAAMAPKFNITRMNQSTTTPTVVEDFSATPGLLDSLKKPVMLRVTDNADKKLSEIVRLCPKLDGSSGEPTSEAAAIPTPFVTTLSITDKQHVIIALQNAIARTGANDLSFNKMQQKADGDLLAKFLAEVAILITDPTALTEANRVVNNSELHKIAALTTSNSSGGCFLPAPMQVLNNQYDKRESLTRPAGWTGSYILQSNIKSLTAWNRDGIYWGTLTSVPPADPAVIAVPPVLSRQSAADRLFTRKASTSLPTVDQLPIVSNTRTVAGAECDYDCLGLGSLDGVRSNTTTTTTQGGLVWHYSLINRAAPYNYVSNTDERPDLTPPTVATRDDNKGLSEYGFAFSGAARLPGALTISSDQAIYIQGDYNNPTSTPGIPFNADGTLATDELDSSGLTVRTSTNNPPAREKRPAAILADSMIVLSNNCLDINYKLNCLVNWTAALPGDADPMRLANNTVVRAAILSGTEATIMNGTVRVDQGGGLNNHVSFRENWQGQTFKYRGSLVSKGISSEFNGRFLPGCLGNCGGGLTYSSTYFFPPTRDFGFDTDFNSIDGLPPLTPNVNLVQQKVYRRDYDTQNR
jgi:hypothetical protein